MEMDTSWAMEGHGNDRFGAVSTTRTAPYLPYGSLNFVPFIMVVPLHYTTK